MSIRELVLKKIKVFKILICSEVIILTWIDKLEKGKVTVCRPLAMPIYRKVVLQKQHSFFFYLKNCSC